LSWFDDVGAPKAFAMAVLVPGLLLALAVAGFFLLDGDSSDRAWAAPAFFVSFFAGLVVIALAGAAFGLPLTAILKSSRLERPWTYPLAGLILGAALMLLIAIIADGGPHNVKELLPFVPMGALPGAISGAIWWIFHRRHRQWA
jgi:hypothetical protein